MGAPGTCTVIGFGSLLSQRSAKSTFSQVSNFRLAWIDGFRRVFRHPAGFFFDCGLVPPENSKAFCSLSVERHDGTRMLVTVFEIPDVEYKNLDEREAEYNLVLADFTELDGEKGRGVVCLPSSDEEYIKRFGQEEFEKNYGRHGFSTLWGHAEDSGILPCTVYLRHCVLAAQSNGEDCKRNFLDTTFLVDRSTTVRAYLENNKWVMDAEVPACVRERYNG